MKKLEAISKSFEKPLAEVGRKFRGEKLNTKITGGHSKDNAEMHSRNSFV